MFSARFVIAVLFFVVGIAWIAYYYIAGACSWSRPETGGSPAWMADLGDWNYLIGFGLIMLGLASRAPRARRWAAAAASIMMLGLLPGRAALDLHVLRVQRRHQQHPGLQRPRPVQPGRRHRAGWRSASPTPPAGSDPLR